MYLRRDNHGNPRESATPWTVGPGAAGFHGVGETLRTLAGREFHVGQGDGNRFHSSDLIIHLSLVPRYRVKTAGRSSLL